MMSESLASGREDGGIFSAASTVELNRRPSRPANYGAENAALLALVDTMAIAPDNILQKLSDTALALCGAHSAGLSLLEDEDRRENFHWRAISGEWSSNLNGSVPRKFSPCGVVLDRNMPLLFSHPERDFPYLRDVNPVLEEGLLIPFYINGEACGTIWVVAHDASKRFDAEDLRVMTSLGRFASVAHQTVLSRAASVVSDNALLHSNATIERYSAIIESSDDAILSKNLDGIINTWNPGAERIFGYTAEEAIGQPVTMLFPPDRADEEPSILERVRRGERIDHYETKRVRKDGTLLDISLTVSPIRDRSGRVIGASKIARDISERARANERQALLVNEIKHRIKNTLATVQAIAMQTLRDTPVEERDAFISRLHSLANAHDVLTSENWNKASVKDLVSQALAPFREEGTDRLNISGPEVWLNASKSLLLTMAIHELATNAAKYGALSNDVGRVSVSWQMSSPTTIALLWQESGGPAVAPPKTRGFGSHLIEKALKSGPAHATLEFAPTGLICRLVLETSQH